MSIDDLTLISAVADDQTAVADDQTAVAEEPSAQLVRFSLSAEDRQELEDEIIDYFIKDILDEFEKSDEFIYLKEEFVHAKVINKRYMCIFEKYRTDPYVSEEELIDFIESTLRQNNYNTFDEQMGGSVSYLIADYFSSLPDIEIFAISGDDDIIESYRNEITNHVLMTMFNELQLDIEDRYSVIRKCRVLNNQINNIREQFKDTPNRKELAIREINMAIMDSINIPDIPEVTQRRF